MRIAIHQPNYLPWLGYFHKIARSDVFIFLDDAQFSKGSYTNRTRIRPGDWLTIPVKHKMGQPIDEVEIADKNWAPKHLDKIRDAYQSCDHYEETMDVLEPFFRWVVPYKHLVPVNITFIRAIAYQTDHDFAEFYLASELGINPGLTGTARLVALVKAVDPHGVYLSGETGRTYQDAAGFLKAGIGLEYLNFKHPEYPQRAYPERAPEALFGQDPFVPGLSIMDAAFNVGWEKIRSFLR